jgi:hypothetical protein
MNVATMVVSCFGFAYYTWSGKNAAKQGHGIHHANQNWHKEIDANSDESSMPSIKKNI